MGKKSAHSLELKSIIDELEVVRLDRHAAPLGVLPRIRKLLGVEAVIFLRFVEKVSGWIVEGFESDGLQNATRARRVIADYFASHAEPASWVDLAQPDARQCNRLVVLDEMVPPDKLLQSGAYHSLLKPLGLHDHHVMRVLLHDSMTCGWFGVVSTDRLDVEQRAQAQELVTPLLTRLRIERLLASAPRIHAALEATLHHIGAPALVVDGRGRIHELNRAARELLAKNRDAVQAALRDLVAGKSSDVNLTLTPIDGVQGQYLAVMRPRSMGERRELAISLAAYRWKLTARQVEVLERIVHGESNSEIAAGLSISERATEMHVSALFDRARVVNRAQLVAAVLLT